MRICHLTSAHSRHDVRVFLKQCRSLRTGGHDVSLVVADGKGDDERDGVGILDVGVSGGRLDRMLNATRRVFARARSLNADVYHLHDPELLPAGRKLKRLGRAVIFDAHEDLPKQLLSAPYLNQPFRWVLSRFFATYERWACRQLDGVIAATPCIRDKFLHINPNTVNINNFPLLGELSAGELKWAAKRAEVCYVGGIERIRGIEQLVQAMALTKTDVRLQLGGRFSDPSLEKALRSDPGWSKVDAHGYLDRQAVGDVLRRAVGGVVTFHPAPNHIDAQPNKMFEYMSAGVPVIASHFPLWKRIIEGNDCGLCVDPLDPGAIAEAIDFLLLNPEQAERMGRNGQAAVHERYNWDMEQSRLLDFYQRLREV